MPTVSITAVINDLSEQAIALHAGNVHDAARAGYPLRSNRVTDDREFARGVGDYYNYHIAACLTGGSRMSPMEAEGRAKEILAAEGRRHGRTVLNYYHDALSGTNGGLRMVLDVIADHLKAESVEHYIRVTLDRHIAPSDPAAKEELLRQIAARYGAHIGSAFDASRPEFYASSYEQIVRQLTEAFRDTRRMFERI